MIILRLNLIVIFCYLLFFSYLLFQSMNTKQRKPRKDALYSREEMEVISKHKQEYRLQTTREKRAHVFQSKILVDLFNFWLENGKEMGNDELMNREMKVWFLILLYPIYDVHDNEGSGSLDS